MTSPQFRAAGPDDAPAVAWLHADSWRRHYRGAYSDRFLDGDIDSDRLSVWTTRLGQPDHTATILAHQGDRLVGFVHVVLDDDPRWGSLVDNLHVRSDLRRTGIGRQLLARGAAATERAATPALYLWVLEQNLAAQEFYRRCGADRAERALVAAPGGDPTRLSGQPYKLRMVWPDAAAVARLRD